MPLISQHKRSILLSLLSAIIGYLVANAIESVVIRLVRPEEEALTWISDVVLATGFGIVTYLWLHLKAARSALSRLEGEKIKIDTELSLAAEIQRKLLPSVPAPDSGFRWAARQQQAEKIGGDFYDFIQPGPNFLLMLVGDISGKGIPAALLLASIRTLFRMLCRETLVPAELLDRLAGSLYEENGGSVFLTCILGLFDLKSRTLTYVNAGHPPGLLLNASGRQSLETGGVPAGIFPAWQYESNTIRLQAGDIGIFVTDGISEALERNGSSMAEFLESKILRTPHPLTPDLLCEEIMQLAFDSPKLDGDKQLEDDQTVLAFMVDG